MTRSARSRTALLLLFLAALAVLAYAPLIRQPLLQDDYPNIQMARTYGSPAGWGAMLSDGVFRYRATWWLLANWTDRVFGVSPAPIYAVTVALHVLAVWLVFALGVWPAVGWRVSGVAAAFFAVYEGHQEAVLWYSAANETLQFIFGVAGFICWLKFLERGGWRWYAASIAAFCLALLSKETAVVFVPLLLIPLASAGLRRRLYWAPFALLALGDVWMILGARSYSFRFEDGSFSWQAPFWITWPESYLRMLWIWGVVAVITLLVLRAVEYRGVVLTGAAWMGIALLPYSFLTYMHRVPSRHTYLASAGLSWIVAAGFLALRARMGRRWAALAAIVVIAANIGYLWTRKRRQFLDRAAPTEALIALARQVQGPIYVRCFPYPPIVADAAVQLREPRATLIWNAAQAHDAKADFCFMQKK